ncbi:MULTISPECIES: MipA/OmpV family protein [unclassified Pseudoalteromonas]|uniref:MipA/OmpV family protein n=1 Tax=unclassified Pseudoalteromonas TaxID=194690 RepID=UPI000C082AF5|nr:MULTISPECIES: MipA/OmpV family protein [unclassified Pseudoalteromonas]MDP2634085.1 MipA/OmpV family protein [Pseudoalteromonas sp. 1_MG-2023]PHN90687.1 hypothetical protein CSC79_06010 [Pseudoalteromonas sp. 3D05]
MLKLFGLMCLVSMGANATVQDTLKQQQLIKKSTLHASITVGVGGIQNPVLNSKNFISPILPNFSYYDDNWFIDNFAVGYSLFEKNNFYFDVAGRFNEDGFFFKLDGIEKLFAAGSVSGGFKDKAKPLVPEELLTPIDRDLSYLVGLSSGYVLSNGLLVELSLMHDITNVHNGYEGQLNMFKTFRFGESLFGLELGVTYKSLDLIEYYYTVGRTEGLVRIPDYHSEKAVNYHLKASYTYPLSDSFSVDINVKHTWLDSDLVLKPMITDNAYFSGFAGITYHF